MASSPPNNGPPPPPEHPPNPGPYDPNAGEPETVRRITPSAIVPYSGGPSGGIPYKVNRPVAEQGSVGGEFPGGQQTPFQLFLQAIATLGNQLGVATGAVNAAVAQLATLNSKMGQQTAAAPVAPRAERTAREPGPVAPRAGRPPVPPRGPAGAAAASSRPSGDNPADLVGQLIGRMAAAIGPLAVLGAVINSQGSGVQVFLKAMNLLGAVLAPIVLPAFIGLSGLLIALSGELSEDLAPIIEKLYDVIFPAMVSAVENGILAFEKLGAGIDDTIQDMMLAAVKMLAWIERQNPFGSDREADKLDALAAAMAKKWGGDRNDRDDKIKTHEAYLQLSPEERRVHDILTAETKRLEDARRGDKDAKLDWDKINKKIESGEGPGNSSFGEKFKQGLRMAADSFRMSLGSPASTGSTEEIYKTAQLAALNQDPIEAMIYQQLLKLSELLDRKIGATNKILDDKLKPAVGN